jgi:M6 family metalloprotease-like protein
MKYSLLLHVPAPVLTLPLFIMFPYPYLQQKKMLKSLAILAFALALAPATVGAIPANSKTFSPPQPNGHPTACQLQLIGNPGYHYVICQATPEGYYSTAVNQEDGFIYYGELQNGILVPGTFQVGGDGTAEDNNILKGQIELPAEADQQCMNNDYCAWKIENNGISGTSPPDDDYSNLVIPFKFADHSDRTIDVYNIENDIFNDDHISVKDYFETMSGGTMSWSNQFAEVVTISKTESYCADNVSGTSEKIKECLAEALELVAAQGIFVTDYDGVSFIHSGYGAENGDKDDYHTYVDDRIWSHSWEIESDEYSGRYALMSAYYGAHGGRYMHAGTAIHEIGQMLGAPTLYGPEPGNGLGYYDVMSNPYGFDGDLHHPGSLSAYSKMVLEWADVQEIESEGTYTIEASSNKIYKISVGFPTDEYYLIENRVNSGYDKGLAGPGLAIYHVDGSANGKPGFPGDGSYPANRYRVSLIQADGRFDLEMEEDQGDNGDLFYAGNVDGFTSDGPLVDGEPTGAEYPNTKSYKDGQFVNTGLTIKDISVPGESMSFTVMFASESSQN